MPGRDIKTTIEAISVVAAIGVSILLSLGGNAFEAVRVAGKGLLGFAISVTLWKLGPLRYVVKSD